METGRSRPLPGRIGLRVAQAGGALMILGGAGDLTIRSLLPNHLEFLGLGAGPVPPATEALVLALLHALGAALIASGLAVIVLLRAAQLTARAGPALAAAAIAMLAEGMNAVGMYRTGSPFYVAPLAFMAVVLTGVALYTLSPTLPPSAVRGHGGRMDTPLQE